MEDPRFDSAIDSDSDLMMMDSGMDSGEVSGWVLCRIFCGGSSMEDLLWRILALILLWILIRI